MEVPFALLIGIFFAAAVYLMLSKFLVRILLGVAILGNAVNLLLFTTGRIVREPSKRVEIVLPGGDDDAAKLEAIADAYKVRFRQQAVGIVVRPACVSF